MNLTTLLTTTLALLTSNVIITIASPVSEANPAPETAATELDAQFRCSTRCGDRDDCPQGKEREYVRYSHHM